MERKEEGNEALLAAEFSGKKACHCVKGGGKGGKSAFLKWRKGKVGGLKRGDSTSKKGKGGERTL